MTYERESLSLAEPVAEQETGSYLDWGAIIGGIVFASALSVVMLAFGSAIGLSFSTSTVSAKGFAIGAGIGAALWFVWVEVSSFMAGAYLTGRLRKRKHDSTEHEVEVRDGSHGLLVWAGAILIGSYIAHSGVSSVVNSVGSIAKTAAISASTMANSSTSSPMQYYTDVLLRGPAAGAATPMRTDRTMISSEINTILAKAALPTSTDTSYADDKAYLAQLVAQETGVTADVANTRVNDAYTSIESAKADVVKAAETARRVGIIAAFLLAASLLVSAAAAYWAATLGGKHRDEAVVFTGFFRRI